jgi:hypothetical protein
MSFPCFENPNLIGITLCLFAKLKNDEKLDFDKNNFEYFATHKSSTGNFLVRLKIDTKPKSKKGIHVHVDYLLKNDIDKDHSKVNSDATQINGILDKFKEIDVVGKSFCQFEIKEEDIKENSIIRSLGLSKSIGGIKLKLKGIIFDIEGAPISELGWSFEKGHAYIGLESKISEKYDHNLIIRQMVLLEKSLKTFVLGE